MGAAGIGCSRPSGACPRRAGLAAAAGMRGRVFSARRAFGCSLRALESLGCPRPGEASVSAERAELLVVAGALSDLAWLGFGDGEAAWPIPPAMTALVIVTRRKWIIFILALQDSVCCRPQGKSSSSAGRPAGASPDRSACLRQLRLPEDAVLGCQYPWRLPQVRDQGRRRAPSSIERACVWTLLGTWRRKADARSLSPGGKT